MEENIKGWENKTINELCIIGRGRVISQNEIFNKIGDFPVYSSQIQNNGEMGKIDTYDFDGDYVTWTTDGAYAGTVFFRTGKFNCTNVCGTLKPKIDEELDLRFLAYLLSTKAKSHVSYIGNPKLMNSVMAKISLQLPCNKSEQQKIAEILSKTDKAIAETEALIAKYNRIKTGLMQDLLTKGIDENGQIRSEETHEFKDSALGRIPKDWEVVSIGELGDWKGGKTPNKSINKYWNNGKYIWYSSKDIVGNLLDNSFYKITSEAITEGNQSVFPAYKSLIFVFRSGILRHTLPVARSKKDFSVNQDIKVLVPYKRFSSSFLFQKFKSLESYFLKVSVKAGTTVESIDGNLFFKTEIGLPQSNEQNIIISTLDNSDNYIKSLESELSKFQSLKTGLMQDLLSGKVRVNKGIPTE